MRHRRIFLFHAMGWGVARKCDGGGLPISDIVIQ